MSLDSVEDRTTMSMLADRYRHLLTPAQRQVLRLYLDDDLSLSEVAERLKVSRAAVYDRLRRSVASLEHYEAALQLVSRDQHDQELITRLQAQVRRLEKRLLKAGLSRHAEVVDV